jgi:hypothetical protein
MNDRQTRNNTQDYSEMTSSSFAVLPNSPHIFFVTWTLISVTSWYMVETPLLPICVLCTWLAAGSLTGVTQSNQPRFTRQQNVRNADSAFWKVTLFNEDYTSAGRKCGRWMWCSSQATASFISHISARARTCTNIPTMCVAHGDFQQGTRGLPRLLKPETVWWVQDCVQWRTVVNMLMDGNWSFGLKKIRKLLL